MGLYCSRIILFLKGQIEMDFLIERYNNWTKNPQNGENLFFAGFIIYMFWSIMRTTMFPHSSMAFNMCLVFSVLILAVKIVFFDVYTFKMFMAVAGMFACSAIVFVSSGYFWPFLWVLMLVSAKDVPFKKILQLYLLLNIIIMGLAFIAAMLGVIENLAYNSDNPNNDTLRYSFGCVYTTDFAAHIFFMLLTAYYLYYKSLRWYHYAGTCIIAGAIYYYCNARLDTICILLLVVFFGIYHIMRWQKEREQITVPSAEAEGIQLITFKRTRTCLKLKKLFAKLALISMPVTGLFMYLITSAYSPDDELLESINLTITGRLALGKKGLKQFGVSLFGKDVPMEGMGGSLVHTKPYFFIDCSYLFILLRYGILFLGIVFLIYGVICYKRKEDTALMLAILLLAISSAIDHHLLEEAYNPLSYALFAGTGEIMLGKRYFFGMGSKPEEEVLESQILEN